MVSRASGIAVGLRAARFRIATFRRLLWVAAVLLAAPVGPAASAASADDELPMLPLDADVRSALGDIAGDPAVLALQAIVPAGARIEAVAIDLPGGGQHWVALARPGYPGHAYDARTLLDTGEPEAVLAFDGLPSGQYELRLFLDWPAGGYAVVSRDPVLVSADAGTDRARAARLAAVLASLPDGALGDRLAALAAAAVGFPTAAAIEALARAFASEADAYGEVAAEHESAEALALAIGYAAAAVDLDPVLPEARLTLARAYLSAPNTVEFHADAEAVLHPLLTQIPDDPRPRLLLARIAADLEDFAAAAAIATPLLRAPLAPEDAAAVAVLVAGCYVRSGTLELGIERFAELLARHPDGPVVRLVLAVLLKHAGRLDESRLQFRQVVEGDWPPEVRAAAARLAEGRP